MARCCGLRNKLLPLVDLKALLAIGGRRDGAAEGSFIVVMQVGMQSFGLVVDRRFRYRGNRGEADVEQASLRIAVFSGNTILGDGFGDPQFGIRTGSPMRSGAAGRRGDPSPRSAESAERPSDGIDARFPRRLADPEAVPLTLVTPARRDRRPDHRGISNGRPIVQYHRQLMPLVPATGEDEDQEQRDAASSGVPRMTAAPWA